MKHNIEITILFSLFAAACVPSGKEGEHTTRDALSAPGGDQCAQVTDAVFDELRAHLDEGLALAEADFAANGVNGAYAVAAQYSRDGIATAIGELDEHRAWLAGWASDGDPTSINYVEGGATGSAMWRLIDGLQYSVHWGSISAIYHRSEEARAAVEEVLQAIEIANEIHARGTRCYVDIYLQ
jgi:hypothetical protein